MGADPCADVRRERVIPIVTPRLAAPMPDTNLRRVVGRCLLLATLVIVISSHLANPVSTYMCSPTSLHLAGWINRPRDGTALHRHPEVKSPAGLVAHPNHRRLAGIIPALRLK